MKMLHILIRLFFGQLHKRLIERKIQVGSFYSLDIKVTIYDIDAMHCSFVILNKTNII